MPGPMPRPSDEAKAAFKELVPSDPAVLTRPMFGNISAFVNGNMFAGLFGEDLFVRLAAEDRERVIRKGGTDFSPMPGRAMKDYVTVPPGWLKDRKSARGWVSQALAWTAALPPKEAKKPTKKK